MKLVAGSYLFFNCWFQYSSGSVWLSKPWCSLKGWNTLLGFSCRNRASGWEHGHETGYLESAEPASPSPGI